MSDKQEAYRAAGGSAAGSTDAMDLDKEFWNDLKEGGTKLEDTLTDPSITAYDFNSTLQVKGASWFYKHQLIRKNLERFRDAAKKASCCICPEWLIAIWWDERARMASNEMISDDLSDAFGRDASMGAFQMTGATAKSTLAWVGGTGAGAGYTHSQRQMDEDDLRDEIQNDFDFAARLAADFMCRILSDYRAASWDPCAQGSISAIELIGTAWSLSYKPKTNPKTNGRGAQVATFAKQAAEKYDLPECNCDDCPGGAGHHHSDTNEAEGEVGEAGSQTNQQHHTEENNCE